MTLDDLDIKVLRENYDDETISEIDTENLKKILKYLDKNGIYYAKDLVITYLNLFLLPANIFMEKFEKLKLNLGANYIDKLGEDISLIEIMYQD